MMQKIVESVVEGNCHASRRQRSRFQTSQSLRKWEHAGFRIPQTRKPLAKLLWPNK